MRHSLHPGDEIILSELEHHSNLLPWQALAAEKQLHLKFLPVNLDTGKIELGELRNLLTSSTKLVAVSHASNVLGAINDIQQLKKILQEQGSGALILLDASQTCASHFLDVENLGADFVVFSGHKMYASAGIGILWGKTPALTALSPTMLGGGTVTTATKTDSTLKELPQRLEGGTLNTEGILSLATACTFLRSLGFEAIHQHLVELSTYARSVLSTIPGLTCISPEDSYSIISFSIDGIHSHDISQACADQNICIRAGQHCTGPLHQVLNVSSTCRISFGLYSTQEDIDALVRVLTDVSMAYRA
jgi:cysteine desulfurase/selenocysteine lyase